MTVHVLLADPPRDGLVLPDLPDTSPLTESEATALYEAMVKDACVAAATSGGSLLVNYPPADDIPPEHETGRPPEADLRAVVTDALEDPGEARFEVQVGSGYDARVGNTVTHLLRDEDESSVAVVDPRAPLLARKDLDSAAMKLRRRDVVLGPSDRGRVHYAGFTHPIDFAGAYTTPELDTLTARARDAGGDVDFLSHQPLVRTGSDLETLLPTLDARRRAGRITPTHTARYLAELGVHLTDDGLQRA
ncbi:hypothetical protein [Salarchaeum sp. JOR-1]|uniref:hypothetical protein n=1 Tax=Salarchaeum sp. JOR-1 TaxID=2599399 RepID=UPI0011988D0F|nr:hypothetical protein [Salarchaeum sp. JOR-1]QDX40857.1 hypothetical protein FQU85_08065 [Salarchaeum sp. JOR-1]